jgi:hypothetical protein
LESSYEGGLHIIFPELRTKANIGQHDIYLDVRPMNTTDNPLNPEYPTTLCRDITEFQQNVHSQTDCLDNILHDLRRYFDTVKTKCQLGLNVPAGFRRRSALQKEFLLHMPPRKSKSSDFLLDIDTFSSLGDTIMDSNPSTPIHSNCSSDLENLFTSQPIDFSC